MGQILDKARLLFCLSLQNFVPSIIFERVEWISQSHTLQGMAGNLSTDNEDYLSKLRDTPITKLNLGRAGLRRHLKNGGYEYLPGLLSLSDGKFESVLSDLEQRDIDVLSNARKQYQKDPEAFACAVLQAREVDNEQVEETISRVESSMAVRVETQRHNERVYATLPVRLPDLPFSKSLSSFEQRARNVFDDLCDQYETVMVYQSFPKFTTEFEEISSAFQELFKHYRSQPMNGLHLIGEFLPNIFLVYAADRARVHFDGKNLWDNFFQTIDLTGNSNAQTEFKKLLIAALKSWRMPIYGKEEETNYYLYTALLHGGLSEETWEDLWEQTLLPIAKKTISSDPEFWGKVDGRLILRKMKEEADTYAPRKSVRNIIAKAPDYTIAELFDDALRVALQVQNESQSIGATDEYVALNAYGLPDAAMMALENYQSKRQESSRQSSAKTTASVESRSKKTIAFPQATLRLVISQGAVFLHWDKVQLPSTLEGCRIEYYVNDEKQQQQDLLRDLAGCVLEELDLPVKPQSNYKVELRLIDQGAKGKSKTLASQTSNFERNRPRCYEFIRGRNGTYRLRRTNEKITSSRFVAFIVEDGYTIKPNYGMKPIESDATSGDWQGTRILVFEVEPGASASLISAYTKEELATWHESYSVQINKPKVLGKTANGLDLYGYTNSELDTNAALPTIYIEGADGRSALDDLDISCSCDGQRVSVPRKICWEDEYEDSSAAEIVLDLHQTNRFPDFVERCELKATQKAADNRTVFRYCFSLLPIECFKPVTLDFSSGVWMAGYQFKSRMPIYITGEQGNCERLDPWNQYSALVPLKDEQLGLKIEHEGASGAKKSVQAQLDLAAIDIEVPKKLFSIAEKRTVCFADVCDLGIEQGDFKIKTTGRRNYRGIYIAMDNNPLFYRELSSPCECSVNLVVEGRENLQLRDGETVHDLPLELILGYGEDISEDGKTLLASAKAALFTCRKGYGFSSWRLQRDDEKRQCIMLFDAPVLCNLHLKFTRRRAKDLVGEADLGSGENVLVLPEEVVHELDSQKRLNVTFMPVNMFNKPDEKYASTFALER